MEFKTVKFGEKGKALLAPFKEVSYYASSISPTEQMLLTSFDLIWFKQEEQTVGYAIVGKVTRDAFAGDEDAEEIAEVMEKGKEYVYVPYFEIFDDYQSKGLGSLCFEKLKKQLEGETIMVYTTDDSFAFWFHNGFERANYSDWWLTLTA